MELYKKFSRLAVLLCILPGCRYYNWASKSFKQVDKRSSCYELVMPYRCSTTLYDGLNTVGMFDILWYSDAVRNTYQKLSDDRFGVSAPLASPETLSCGACPLNAAPVNAEQNVSDSKNQSRLIFYLVTTSAEDSMVPLFATANNKNSIWSAVLKQGDAHYPAVEIKKVSLTPELKAFFAHHVNRYRDIYRIEFNRYAPDGTDLMPTPDTIMCVSLRSVQYEVTFCWDSVSCKGTSCKK